MGRRTPAFHQGGTTYHLLEPHEARAGDLVPIGARRIPAGEAAQQIRHLLAARWDRSQILSDLVGQDPSLRGHYAAVGDTLAAVAERLRRGQLELWHSRTDVQGIGRVEGEDTAPPPTKTAPAVKLTWIEIELLDEVGGPIPGERYRVDLPDGTTREGRLDHRGLAYVDRIPAGRCTVSFPDYDKDAWEKTGTSKDAKSRSGGP
ncbi:MAG: hypothetical protein U0414_10695 [Polyangiaceae bacterium]